MLCDPISTIAGYIASGYNGGNWNGPGIISSAAQTSASQPPRNEPAASLFQRAGPEPVLAAAVVALNGLIHDTLCSQRHGAGAEPVGDVSAGL